MEIEVIEHSGHTIVMIDESLRLRRILLLHLKRIDLLGNFYRLSVLNLDYMFPFLELDQYYFKLRHSPMDIQ